MKIRSLLSKCHYVFRRMNFIKDDIDSEYLKHTIDTQKGNGMRYSAWNLCPYCLMVDISWVTKNPPWSGASKVLGYNPSIRYIPELGDLLIVLISKPSSYGRRQPTLLFGVFKNISDLVETILIIQHSEAIHIVKRTISIKMEYLFLCETIHTIVTLVIQHMYLHETVSTSPMEYLFLCRTIHTIHLINTLVSVLMKLS